MKILILLNKNTNSLNLLLNSLKEKIEGHYECFIFDCNSILKNTPHQNIIFVSKLKENVIDIISKNVNNNFMIIDENKFAIDKIDVDGINNALNNEDLFCFGLSLGKNITHCSSMNCSNVFIPEREESNIVVWDWSKHYFDFGFPLNLDGTVFRGKELLKFIKNISFTNSEELENNLQIFDNYPKTLMCSYKNNKLIEVIFENDDDIKKFNKNELYTDRNKFTIMKK